MLIITHNHYDLYLKNTLEVEFKGSRVRDKYDTQLELFKDKIIVSYWSILATIPSFGCNTPSMLLVSLPCFRNGTKMSINLPMIPLKIYGRIVKNPLKKYYSI